MAYAIMALSYHWNSVLLAIIGILIADCLYSRYWNPLARYPGPFWASITNLWRFFTYFGGRHHIIDQSLHERYGPVIRIGPNSLSFSTISAYESIYGYGSNMEKGDWYQPTRDTESNHSALFGIQTNEEQRSQRKKVLGAAFSGNKVASYRPVIEKHVQRFLQEIAKSLTLNHNSTLDLAETLHQFTFEVYYEVVFGEMPSCNTLEDRYKTCETIKVANKALGIGHLPWLGMIFSCKPIANFLRRPIYSKTGQLEGFSAIARQSFTRSLGRQQEVIKSTQPSILQNLLLVSRDDEKRLPDRVIALETFNTLFAGSGTSSAALASILHYLGQQEGHEWQHRIRQESDEKQVTARQSPSLTAVIKETMRLDPPFPSGMPRTTTASETSINVDDSATPISLPRNTTVSCNAYILGRSKDIWGPEADSWRPERWFEKPTTAQQLSPEERFVVFGKGPRSCIGRELAMILLAETIARILEVYEIRSSMVLKGRNFFEMQYDECLVELVER